MDFVSASNKFESLDMALDDDSDDNIVTSTGSL
jgi:hypothetical protein